MHHHSRSAAALCTLDELEPKSCRYLVLGVPARVSQSVQAPHPAFTAPPSHATFVLKGRRAGNRFIFSSSAESPTVKLPLLVRGLCISI